VLDQLIKFGYGNKIMKVFPGHRSIADKASAGVGWLMNLPNIPTKHNIAKEFKKSNLT
jgi:hypothetical protein